MSSAQQDRERDARILELERELDEWRYSGRSMDANRLASLNTELSRLQSEQSSPPQDVREALNEMLERDRMRYEKTPEAQEHFKRSNAKALAALAQSDAEPKRAQLRLEEDAQGKRAMLGGYQMPDALIPALETQSDAEPVAWQYRWRINEGSPWTKWTECDKNYSVAHATTEDMEFRSLYTAPPRPDPSDAQPVAWEYKTPYGWKKISLDHYEILKGSSYEMRPVFDTAPPRPDASDAKPVWWQCYEYDASGLIEAAKIAEAIEKSCLENAEIHRPPYKGANPEVAEAHENGAAIAHQIATAIRARAADRRGK